MNYSEMSGYEINNHLHNALACEGKYDLKVEGYKVTWKDRETGRVLETLRNHYDKEFKDYLSSWADAGPIIHKYGIAIAFDEFEQEWVAFSEFRFDKSGWDMEVEPKKYHHNKDPLRAAMIVFLMMQEAK